MLLMEEKALDEGGCLNCGMIEVPLTNGFCEGCTCWACNGHGSLDSYGLCRECADAAIVNPEHPEKF